MNESNNDITQEEIEAVSKFIEAFRKITNKRYIKTIKLIETQLNKMLERDGQVFSIKLTPKFKL